MDTVDQVINDKGEKIISNSIELVRLTKRLINDINSSENRLELKIRNSVEPLLFYLHMGMSNLYVSDRSGYLMKAYSLLKASKKHLMLYKYLGYGDTSNIVNIVDETARALVRAYPRMLV